AQVSWLPILAADIWNLDDVEELQEEETGEETKIKACQLTLQMMQNPQILAALQERLDGLVETPTGYIESLLRVVKRRVNTLKNLQVSRIETKFYEEVHNLERKYAVLYQPLLDKRFEIINAIDEPTEEECEWKSDKEDEISEELEEKAKIEDEKKDEEKEDPKGILEFWLTVFKNVDLFSDMVQQHDEPILKHLKDTKVKLSAAGQPMSFVLEFHFEPNDYFTNEVLTNTYRKRSEPDDFDPFSFDGPEIMGCTECQTDWKKGKDKQQKNKGRGTVRTVTNTVSSDSFFNFFAPPEVPENFKIGHFLHECIIPRSVSYLTGEAIEVDDDVYDEEGEEADEFKTSLGNIEKPHLYLKKKRKKERKKVQCVIPAM
uniref:Nucleosome assembly protein 1 like 1 n=1 Tax=Rhinopithecus roxellana TaxID=61622 RepID=A0A2K6Q5B0_RHIRO